MVAGPETSEGDGHWPGDAKNHAGSQRGGGGAGARDCELAGELETARSMRRGIDEFDRSRAIGVKVGIDR
uniref:Uncharacterized protein n=1 Tax=Arundo donax TaxID=35708 RepID=A0A0A9A947_ARUDO